MAIRGGVETIVQPNQLEYFVAIVDHGGFTAAADALSLSQPTLSNAVKSLERELGVPLLHRLSKGVRPTPAGEVLATSARQILRDLERARFETQAVADVVVGTLDITTLPGLLLHPLASVIGRFRVEYPSASVRVQHASCVEDAYRSVASGAAELGFSDVIAVDDQHLVCRLISQQELVALVPSAHELAQREFVTRRELLASEVITGPPGTLGRDLLDSEALRLGRTFTPKVEVNLRGSAIFFVLASAGIAIMPRPFADLAGAGRVTVVPIVPSQVRRAFLIHRDETLSPAADALRRIIGELASDVGPCDDLQDHLQVQ